MDKTEHFLLYLSDITETEAFLGPEELHHGHTVLRLCREDHVLGTDGRGNLYTCIFESVENNRGRCRIIDKKHRMRPAPLVRMYIGLPDHSAFEKAIESLVPLGVSGIVPVECNNCRKPWWARGWEKQSARFRRKMVAAIKQARIPWMPEIERPVTLDACLGICGGPLVAADPAGVPLAEAAKAWDSPACFSCFVGPPGGFSEQEMKALSAAGASKVRIAPNRLRTELAAIALAAQIAGLTGERWPEEVPPV
jgi:16S rRNA (uracil1498-N3)-methyltransferase